MLQEYAGKSFDAKTVVACITNGNVCYRSVYQAFREAYQTYYGPPVKESVVARRKRIFLDVREYIELERVPDYVLSSLLPS